MVSLGNVKGATNKPQRPRSQVSLVSRVPPSLHLPTRISCTTVRDLAEVSTAYVYHCPVGNRILFPISSYLACFKLRIIVTWAFGWGLWNLVFSKEVVFKNIWSWSTVRNIFHIKMQYIYVLICTHMWNWDRFPWNLPLPHLMISSVAHSISLKIC